MYMRKLWYLVTLLSLSFVFSEVFLETLKITREDAQAGIWYSFSGGNYSGPASKTYHELAVPVRLSLIKEIGAFAKSYSRSDDFKKRYAEYREGQKPNAPEPLVTTAELKAQQKDALQKSLHESEEALKTATGDLRKVYQDVIATLKEQLKQLDDPNNPMFSKDMDNMMKQGKEQEMKDYQAKLAKWQTDYPESPDKLIKERLRYFLELSSTVDFNAKIAQGKYGKMVFVNEDYESNKSSDWKLLYRCGKESVDAARKIASDWLTELK